MCAEARWNGPCKETWGNGLACEHLKPAIIGMEPRDLDLVSDHDFLRSSAAQPVPNAAVGAVCANQQAAGGGSGGRALLVMNPPTLAFNWQDSRRFRRKQQPASCLDGLLDDALIEPVSTHGTGSGLSGNTYSDGCPVWSVNRGAIDVLEHGVLQPHLSHGPRVDQAGALERSADGRVLFHQQDIDAPFSENGGQPCTDGAGADDDDVVVHGVNPGGVPHEAYASFLLCEAVTHLLCFVQVEDGGERVALL